MERRRSIIAAAGISLSLLAGAAAIGINTQLIDASGDDGVGQISPVSATSSPDDTVYVDEPASATVAPAAPSSDDDDDRYEGRDDDDGERYADGEHEYEGADDDD